MRLSLLLIALVLLPLASVPTPATASHAHWYWARECNDWNARIVCIEAYINARELGCTPDGIYQLCDYEVEWRIRGTGTGVVTARATFDFPDNPSGDTSPFCATTPGDGECEDSGKWTATRRVQTGYSAHVGPTMDARAESLGFHAEATVSDGAY